ncbi:hypothetical protein PORY_000276 [Pneumocystis oryctolagi]|uniref:Uncharacterized protein n=1 Tax=Pneumocystis oryctolagi TaxID=42067 RepID=A0ACB7CGM8_9ASCO|nr:hypothetical protein PORY_000276 [Pneumocystis oryctolagi]
MITLRKKINKLFLMLMKKHFYIDIVIMVTILMHLLISPYIKIEERMNMHAIYDILFFGVTKEGLKNYDHFEFPEGVPRTFIGAFLLSGIVFPIKYTLEWFLKELNKFFIQMLVRASLGIYNSLAISMFRYKVIKRYGVNTGLWYGIFQASQFHVMYYASRTLPNTFAFGICTLLMSCFFENEKKHILKGFEIIILTIAHALYFWACNFIKMKEIIKTCIFSGVAGLLCSIMIDSWFWQKYLWPEGVSFHFNVIQRKSSDWGKVSPWHVYFSKYIPKLLLNPFFFILWGISLFTRKDTVNLLVPNIIFVLIYSLLPHKEWRFVVYVIPSLTLMSAVGATWIFNRRHKSLVFMTMFVMLVIATVASFFINIAMSLISSLNYPGGFAIQSLHDNFNLFEGERVYLDIYTRMTGATLFLQHNEKVMYDRTENVTELDHCNFLETVDWAIVHVSNLKPCKDWEVKSVIKGYSGIKKISFSSIYDTLLGLLILTRICIVIFWFHT